MNPGAIIAAAISSMVIGIVYVGIACLIQRPLDKKREDRRLRRLRQQMDAFGDKL